MQRHIHTDNACVFFFTTVHKRNMRGHKTIKDRRGGSVLKKKKNTK